jgi:Flp pilus assembly protein TadG
MRLSTMLERLASHYAKRFADDTRGAVAMIFALTLLPVLGAVGAAVDYSRLTLAHENLQSVADAAALAGAMALQAKAKEIASVAESAAHAAATAVVAGMAPNAQKTITPTLSTKSVNVKVSEAKHIIFGGFVGKETSTVGAESTAVFNPAPICVTVLEASATGLHLNSSSNLNSNCAIHVNSTSSSAIQVNSSSKIKAGSTCVVGRVFLNGGTIEPAARTGCAKFDDPLAKLPEPSNANNACDYSNTVVQAGTTQTLNPGVYCTKFDVNGGTATLNPGIYIIRDMEIVVNSSGKLLGKDVMLFFMGKSGRLVLNSDSTLNLTGRTSGTYQGMLFFQSRDPITLQTASFMVNSSGSMKTEGTIYMPNGSIQFNDSGITNLTSAYTVIIIRHLYLNSLAKVIVNTDYVSGTPLPTELVGLQHPEGIRLVK